MQPINRYLDHAVLKPQMTRAEAESEIKSGLDLNVRSVCVRPCDIELALDLCDGTDTEVGATLSFPHGCGHATGKAQEAKTYVSLGVHEIDMVANYGLIRSGLYEAVRDDIAAVVAVTKQANVILKVIFETSELEDEQIRKATEAAIAAEADFVKTSTGFASGGATPEAVKAMLETANGRIKVKASGGIRDRAKAEMYLEMGCERLGVGSTSSAIICSGAPGQGGGY